jgi:hypothetical protein
MDRDKRRETAKAKRREAARVKRQNLADFADNARQLAMTLPVDLGTPKERIVLAMKLLPDSWDIPVVQKCNAIGMNRQVWYRIHNRPGFSDRCIRAAKSILGAQAPEVLTKYIETLMKTQSVDAQFNFLKAIGVLNEKHDDKDDQQAPAVGNLILQLFSGLGDEERRNIRDGIAAAFGSGHANRF